ncbi:MAG: 3-hydroxyacyl-ACP dehydratase FabZ [Coxiellaceae bacterium]|jgi:3-hydroxyacyl-[acyl-carrier-protein] dehydratase|nr:3-hydroxyacyl-ACP dehydratase FabZ [Coxiellaceae bacterium]
MSNVINIRGIKEYLPHRYPFLLVDKVLEVEAGKSILALKNITTNEPHFNGHFPQRPIMPGVLMIEALAQTAGLLIYSTTNTRADEKTNWYYLVGIDKARIRRIAEPGDQLRLYVELAKHKQDLWIFNAKTTIDGELACSVELLLVKGALK